MLYGKLTIHGMCNTGFEHTPCLPCRVEASKCLAAVTNTSGAELWQQRSADLAGVVIQLSAAVSSDGDYAAGKEALLALRAIALSLVSGLKNGDLSIAEEDNFQDSLAATLTFVASPHGQPLEEVAQQVCVYTSYYVSLILIPPQDKILISAEMGIHLKAR